MEKVNNEYYEMVIDDSSLVPMPASARIDYVKSQFLLEILNQMKLGQDYHIKLQEQKAKNGTNDGFKYCYILTFKPIKKETIKVVSYDEKMLKSFKKEYGFWKRVKLALRYIFKRKPEK